MCVIHRHFIDLLSHKVDKAVDIGLSEKLQLVLDLSREYAAKMYGGKKSEV